MSSIDIGSSSDVPQQFVGCLSLDRDSSLPSAVGLIVTFTCEMTFCGLHTTERFQRSVIHAVREAISVSVSQKNSQSASKDLRSAKNENGFHVQYLPSCPSK